MDSKSKCHVRSVSLPSRTPHPLSSIAEDQQSSKLASIKEMYDNIEDLLQSPLTRQALSHEQQRDAVEEIVDGSLRLVDVCSTTRDLFSQYKESLQELESSVRRNRSSETNLVNQVNSYMISKKQLCKSITKLKRIMMHKKNTVDHQIIAIKTLTQIEEISLEAFDSLLSSISSPKKTSGWSLVSKYLKSKQDVNQSENLDSELIHLVNKKSNKEINVQLLLKQIEAMEVNIEEVIEELESIFRRLVKTRVSLLNILNN